MLPTRWKIYRVFNFIQLAYTALSLLAFIIAFFVIVKSGPNFTGSMLLLVYALLVVACALNLANLARYNFNKILSGRYFFLHVFASVIMCITWVGFVILSWAAIMDEFGSNPSNDPRWIALALLVAIMSLVQLYIIIFQFRVPSFLRNNQRNSMEKLIDAIGTTPST